MENKKEKINNFEDLKVWKLAHQTVLEIYKLSESFPKSEEYRITSQLLRAVVSIPTNISEGMGRYSKKEFIQFLVIARGSVEECKYLLLLTKDLGYITENEFKSLSESFNSIGKMANALINSLRSTNNQ
ncbi:MAG TPA: four helix bundle protein [Ignavibacteria bacterium]